MSNPTMMLCLECMGEGGWTGPVPVKLPNGRDLRRRADCPACRGRGWITERQSSE